MGPEAEQILQPYAGHIDRGLEAVARDLESYAGLLVRWQRVQNLVSRETLPDLWTRHIADSLQVLKLLAPGDELFVDLGSGGGLPALPIAIARRDNPKANFLLIESNARKASFLRTVARELDLPVTVIADRIEAFDSRETNADVITSRALASLPTLCQLAQPFFRPTTRAIFHRGADYIGELTETRGRWDFDVLEVPSDTSFGAALLEIRNLHEKSVP